MSTKLFTINLSTLSSWTGLSGCMHSCTHSSHSSMTYTGWVMARVRMCWSSTREPGWLLLVRPEVFGCNVVKHQEKHVWVQSSLVMLFANLPCMMVRRARAVDRATGAKPVPSDFKVGRTCQTMHVLTTIAHQLHQMLVTRQNQHDHASR